MGDASIAMRILYGHLKVNTFGIASAGIIRFGASAGDVISGLSHEHEKRPEHYDRVPRNCPQEYDAGLGFHFSVLYEPGLTFHTTEVGGFLRSRRTFFQSTGQLNPPAD